MKRKLRPLLKWTGGKFDEFALFESKIPEFERYIEPFFGGGGVFFALKPAVVSLVNDKSADLISFYRMITNKAFEKELSNYVEAWEELSILNGLIWKNVSNLFTDFIKGGTELEELKSELVSQLKLFLKSSSIFNDKEFLVDPILFNEILLSSIVDKARRIKTISSKENRNFDNVELLSHFETGLRGGVYLFFRKILNLNYLGKIELNEAKGAANWYFVREFCYASMFRFNSKGEFNIPYGGIAYNKRKLRDKINRIFAPDITTLFKNTTFHNHDFEEFLNNVTLKKGDFIFVDPPYDSEFSEYDQSAFNQADQERLAIILKASPAKWMVVIKETNFIRNLYTHNDIHIKPFDKRYVYNVRGRNKRGVTHLIITNY